MLSLLFSPLVSSFQFHFLIVIEEGFFYEKEEEEGGGGGEWAVGHVISCVTTKPSVKSHTLVSLLRSP